MKKTLALFLVVAFVAQAASAVTLYRETFPQLGGWTKAGAWEYTPPATRNGLASGQGWFGYSSKSPYAVAGVPSANPFNSPWGFQNQAATWVLSAPRTPVIPSSPGETDSTQINSAVNTSGGVAFANTVPTNLVLGKPYGDLQSSASIVSCLGWSPQAVYDTLVFTQEYQVNMSELSRIQFEVTSTVGSNYRFLIHIGNDFDQEFPGLDNPSSTLGTGWYVTDSFAQTGSADGSNVWNTMTLDIGPGNIWHSVSLEITGGEGFIVGSDVASPSGLITAFGVYMNNPSGLHRFDNYTLFGVPEPATMSLLGLGVVAMLRRRK